MNCHHLPIAVTPGEPAGIGPDICIMISQIRQDVPLVFICDPQLLDARAEQLGLALRISHWQQGEARCSDAGEMQVLPCSLIEPAEAGKLNSRNAPYVLDTLDKAIDGCLDGQFSAMVTAPVHKGVINDAGVAFTGHTEYLQQRCRVDRVVMMLATRQMKVALATTHLPLLEVPGAISRESLTRVLDILIADMKTKFGIAHPTILIAGLNPHAGEGGHMGREEIEVIAPVMAMFSGNDVQLIGPLPADTLFTPKYLEQADAVLAMYHDQGLPVLKYQGFGEAVNITLGLPILRTSVDHGTALDIAGSGQADTGSLNAAIEMARTAIDSQLKSVNGTAKEV